MSIDKDVDIEKFSNDEELPETLSADHSIDSDAESRCVWRTEVVTLTLIIRRLG